MKADRIDTKTQEVGTCPACKGKILAEITFGLKVGEVKIVDGTVTAETDIELRGCKITHYCGGNSTPAVQS